MMQLFTRERLSRRRLLSATAAGTTILMAGGLARAQASEQVLKIAHVAFEQEWSPLRGGGWYAAWNSLWWASPLRFDAAGKLHPYVFSAWEANVDKTVWRFTIDPVAVFSDGSPITAADIKGGWELNTHPATRNQRVNQFLSSVQGYEPLSQGEGTELAGVAIVDDRTLEVTLTSSDPLFDQKLATHLLPVIKIAQARGEDGLEVQDWWDVRNGVVTSGPFQPESFDLNGGLVEFVPNERFFGLAPKLTRITVQTVEDPVLTTALLQSGEVHAATVLRTPTLVTDLGESFAAGPDAPVGNHFWLNVNREPTNDPKVREALITAIDREALIRVSYPVGPAKKIDQVLTGVPGVDETFSGYAFDPERARALLAESSYGGPERLPKLGMVGVSTPVDQLAAQFIAEQWREHLGIQSVEMKPQYNSYSGADQRFIQFFRDDVSSRVPDAVALLRTAIHSISSNAQMKLGGYANVEVDRLLDEATVKPLDDPDRIRLAQEAQRLFREDFAFIPWVGNVTSKLAIERVQGFERNLDNQIVEPWAIHLT